MLEIRRMTEAALIDSGGDRPKAIQAIIEKITPDVEDMKLVPNDFSIKEMFDAIVDPTGEVAATNSDVRIAEAIDSTAFPYFTQLIMAPTIKKQFDFAFGDVGLLTTELTTKKKKTNIPGYGNFYGPELVGQGQEFPHDEGEENNITVTVHKHGHIIDFTKEMILEDESGIVQDRANKAGIYMGRLVHNVCMNKIQNVTTATINGESTNTAFIYNGTGFAHVSNDHSSVDGQTNDNLSTTAFGQAGLEALELLLALMLDDRGGKAPVMPTVLLVPSALKRAAQKLINSELTYGDANTSINPYKGEFKIVASPYLDANSSTLYYLGDFAAATYLMWRQKPTVEKQGSNSESAFKRDVVMAFKYSTDFNVGLGDYRHFGRGGT